MVPSQYDLLETHFAIKCGEYICTLYIATYETNDHEHPPIVYFYKEWSSNDSDDGDVINPISEILDEDEIPYEFFSPIDRALSRALDATTQRLQSNGNILSVSDFEKVKNGQYFYDLCSFLEDRARCSFWYVISGICPSEEKGFFKCKSCSHFNSMLPQEEIAVERISPGLCSAIDWGEIKDWDIAVLIELPLEDWLAYIQVELMLGLDEDVFSFEGWSEIIITRANTNQIIDSKVQSLLEQRMEPEESNEDFFDIIPKDP